MRWTRLPVVVLLALVVAAVAFAAEDPVNKSVLGGVAIKGYDTVAYFTEGKPVKGRKSFEVAGHGATWRFASAENRDAVEADPGTYGPRFGG